MNSRLRVRLPLVALLYLDVTQPGRVLALGAKSRRFKSYHLDCPLSVMCDVRSFILQLWDNCISRISIVDGFVKKLATFTNSALTFSRNVLQC